MFLCNGRDRSEEGYFDPSKLDFRRRDVWKYPG